MAPVSPAPKARANRAFLMAGALALALVLAGLGAGDAMAYGSRSHGLEQRLDQYQQAGVPAGRLDRLRAELEVRSHARWGPLPYRWVSGSLLRNPLADLEERSSQTWQESRREAREQATSALRALEQEQGPRYDYAGDEAGLREARTPAELRALAERWTAATAQAAQLKRDLETAAGGLVDGRPRDVKEQGDRVRELAGRASELHLVTEPAPGVLRDLDAYFELRVPDQLARHAAVRGLAQAAADQLQRRLDVRSAAGDLAAALPGLLGRAQGLNVAGNFETLFRGARGRLDAAAADEELVAARDELQGLTDRVEKAIAAAQAPAAPACLSGGPPEQIVIHLDTQQLVAYRGGCPWLVTYVTTGRAELPTIRGTFRVLSKAPVYRMISPWPRSSRFWYPDAVVYNAMLVYEDGTFLHNADWQPDWSYGPGSQYGPYASHGCIHVPDGALQQLYDWAAVGTPVTIDG